MQASERGGCLERAVARIVRLGPIPRHVAFIMDGNRRFARRQGLPIRRGHAQGYSSMRYVLRWCRQCGIKVVTVWAFATQNFARGENEVSELFELARHKFRELLRAARRVKRRLRARESPQTLSRNEGRNANRVTGFDESVADDRTRRRRVAGVRNESCEFTSREFRQSKSESKSESERESECEANESESESESGDSDDEEEDAKVGIRISGDLSKLPRDLRDLCAELEQETAVFSDYILNICFVYSFETELCHAMNALTDSNTSRDTPEEFRRRLSSHMYHADLPPIDIVVRSGGDTRLSDFQSLRASDAYLHWTKRLWPELRWFDLIYCLLCYQKHVLLDSK
ncbi:MAG: hypothetical protein MHM6MM_006183 [Cercozoa sp. M6MM]